MLNKCANRGVYTYTGDVDLTDLSMHFTVHSHPECLGVHAEGYGTCSSKGFRLPLLLSLYFVLYSYCGVNASMANLCVMYKLKSQ